MDRRKFVVSTGLGWVGATLGCVPKKPPEDSAVAPSSSPDAQVCPPTDRDIEGPYYREGVPIRSDLNLYGDEGKRLLLAGTLTGSNCMPIANAVVEIWHANPSGAYDTATDEKRYYGQVATDDAGAWSFKTLMPGRYLNGGRYRPAHIHLKAWVDGVARLTTQIYFDGDPYNEGDSWFDEARSVEVGEDGSARFDVAV